MRVNGIIAEYSPFHNGHRYQIEESVRLTGADKTVVVMSGSFTQRGLPALPDKHTRARMALLGGADLVLELPCMYAASSAEFFAYGGVLLLDKIHVVHNLCFGSECGDLDLLGRVADVLNEEPEEFSEALRVELKKGLSFPAARREALRILFPELPEEFLSSPNNILGLEYLKALSARKSRITPVTVKRIGAGYHDESLAVSPSSATAIREDIFRRLSDDDFAGSLKEDDLTGLHSVMPASSLDLLSEFLAENQPLKIDDFSELLLYKLLSEQDEDYTKYWDVSSALSDRIKANLYRFTSFSEFCQLLKTKDMTYNRIGRALLHILLGITAEDFARFHALDLPYARVLGFREDALPLLSEIKSRSEIPLITKLADAQNRLSPEAYEMLRKNLLYESIYEGLSARKSGRPMRHEFTVPIVKV